MRPRPWLIAALLVGIAVPLGASAAPPRLAPDRYGLDEPSLHAVPFSTRLSRRATTQLEVHVPWGAGEIGRLVFFVPRGYRVDLGRPPGAVVGVAVAWSDWGWGDMGRVTADAPEAHIANSCAPGLHDAVWLLRLGVDEREQAVPLFVDRTRGLEGSYRLETCLPRSSELGLRVAMLEIDVDPLTNPARAGAYTWRAFVTPRGADGPDESRAFELRSTVPLPMRLTLRARYDRRSRHAVLTGRFVSSGFDVSGMPVELFVKVGRYFEPLRWTRTGPGGRYSFRRKLRGKATFRAATGAIADCGPSPAPAGCVSESIAGTASDEATVAPRTFSGR